MRTAAVVSGTGFLGRHVVAALEAAGWSVRILSRRTGFNASRPTTRLFDGVDAVINLAGKPIADRRWTVASKKSIVQSRIGATRLLVEACASLPNVPPVLVSGSAIGYYGPRDDQPLREDDPIGSGFLADLCRDWEQVAMEGERLGMRVVRVRIGMVLGRDGGALPRMFLPFRLFLGGPISPGTQWVSWIHLEDLARLLQWAVTTASVTGAVNAVSPHPIHMQEFAATLGKALGRPSWLPVPAFALKFLYGDMASIVTTGARVMPRRLQELGYTYRWPELEPALRAAVKP